MSMNEHATAFSQADLAAIFLVGQALGAKHDGGPIACFGSRPRIVAFRDMHLAMLAQRAWSDGCRWGRSPRDGLVVSRKSKKNTGTMQELAKSSEVRQPAVSDLRSLTTIQQKQGVVIPPSLDSFKSTSQPFPQCCIAC